MTTGERLDGRLKREGQSFICQRSTRTLASQTTACLGQPAALPTLSGVPEP